MIDNWVACGHAGKSVVPRDFYREVDRFEARPEPDLLLGGLVDAIYARVLRLAPKEAQALVAMCHGGPKGRLRALGFAKAQADVLLREFAREVGAIKIDAAIAAAAAKIPQPEPMAEFPEYRVAVERPKIGTPEWRREHFGDEA